MIRHGTLHIEAANAIFCLFIVYRGMKGPSIKVVFLIVLKGEMSFS